MQKLNIYLIDTILAFIILQLMNYTFER